MVGTSPRAKARAGRRSPPYGDVNSCLSPKRRQLLLYCLRIFWTPFL
jgi:hypothetical protein